MQPCMTEVACTFLSLEQAYSRSTCSSCMPAVDMSQFAVIAAVFKRACVQVLTIFFATFLAGSFFNQVQLFVNDPTSVVRILGAAAPQTASFFMSYLLLLGLTTKPVLLLRIPRKHPQPFAYERASLLR